MKTKNGLNDSYLHNDIYLIKCIGTVVLHKMYDNVHSTTLK